jgi:hypothetical protein
MKLNRQQLKKLIIKEYSKMVDEEKLINLSDLPPEDQRKFSRQAGYVYEKDVCEQCGSYMKEEDSTCEECGYSRSTGDVLEEGGCGDDESDYSIDSMAGPVYGVGATSMHVDFPNHGEVHKHKHNNYMAKPSLYKVAKYAQKLLHMIPDGYELDDWQRTKIAQISDDISEVYHSLDYDFSEHDDEY